MDIPDITQLRLHVIRGGDFMAIIATFHEGETKAYTNSMHQHDKGQTLIFVGITLPDVFTAYFSDDKENGISYPVQGKSYQVRIPDVFFSTGEYIYVWVKAENVDEIYSVVIPIQRRSAPIDVDPNDDGERGSGFQGFIMGDDETLIPVVSGSDIPDIPDLKPEPSDDDQKMNGFVMEDDETLSIV
jgi:hypothetical protein